MVQDQLDAARELVDSLSDSTTKTSLVERLNAIQAEINHATDQQVVENLKTEKTRKPALQESVNDTLKCSLYILPPFI